MIREEKRYGWCARGLRLRYSSRARLGSGLASCAPWVNLVLLLFFFAFVASREVLYPGAVLRLPATSGLGATRSGMVAVVLSLKARGGEGSGEIVFFDDEPFYVSRQAHMRELRRRFAAEARAHPDLPLLIEADVHVAYGTIATLCNMAGQAGVREVNLAMRPAEEPGRVPEPVSRPGK